MFAGFYQTMMEWEMCKTWYSDISVGGSGTSFQFSDLRDEDEGSCVKAWMISQFHRELGYAGHYWSGGYRDEYGQYKWATGNPLTYSDFIDNSGTLPYVHLTPNNGYSWNTKSDQNDRNNGCLCRLDRD